MRKLVITLTLPEGAEFTSIPSLGAVQKNVFQETMTFAYYNVTPFQDLSQEATYEYTIFWASFRPTLWVGTAVAILGILALLWARYEFEERCGVGARVRSLEVSVTDQGSKRYPWA